MMDDGSAKRVVTARWLARMEGAPSREGQVGAHGLKTRATEVGFGVTGGAMLVAGGRIVEVGEAGQLARAHPDAQLEDLGDAVILPGLVNAHTHLELSGFTCGERPGSFVDWLMAFVPRAELTRERVEEMVRNGVPVGVEQCLRFGVTAVGDISKHSHVSRPILKDTPLRVVSYGEVQAMARRRMMLEDRLASAADSTHAGERLRIGLTPHAPYTVEMPGYRRCLEVARQRGWPLATHLAETAEEAAFLAEHSEPFRELWDALGWDDEIPRFAGGPIRFARAAGLLDYPTLLAHVNYCDDEELAILAAGRASVVYCPRTHAWFDHPPHRWREMLDAGINVAVGTDSCASSPDLNPVDDLRLLHRIAPEVPAWRLWELATARAAEAIGWDDEIGTLSVGKAADFVVFGAAGGDPLRAILESAVMPKEVWIGGRRV